MSKDLADGPLTQFESPVTKNEDIDPAISVSSELAGGLNADVQNFLFSLKKVLIQKSKHSIRDPTDH